MFVKVHEGYRKVIAICDSELAGKRFEQGIKVLDVRESFFKGEEMAYEKVIELMQREANEDATFNIVGKEAVRAAVEAGIAKKGSELRVKGIPFVLVLV